MEPKGASRRRQHGRQVVCVCTMLCVSQEFKQGKVCKRVSDERRDVTVEEDGGRETREGSEDGGEITGRCIGSRLVRLVLTVAGAGAGADVRAFLRTSGCSLATRLLAACPGCLP
jgi:hypothetical protein